MGDEVTTFYALEILAAVLVSDPRGGSAVVTTTGWSLVERHGDELVVRGCSVSTTRALGTTTTYPPGFVEAAPVATATVGGGGDRFTTSWTTTFGAGDDDRDGHPGVTVHISQKLLGDGDVYVRQTSTTRLDGELEDDGVVRGRADVRVDQDVLDATTWWLKLPTHPKPDPERSTFRMVPIDQGSCEAVEAALRAR